MTDNPPSPLGLKKKDHQIHQYYAINLSFYPFLEPLVQVQAMGFIWLSFIAMLTTLALYYIRKSR